jgi:3-carboxy-cis,cis-muconate cycloisomerase
MAASLAARTLARPSFEQAFGDRAFLRAMLAFECALAEAQADEGLIPRQSAVAIASACEAFDVDLEAFVAEGKQSATLAVPLARLLKARLPKEIARHAHFGATSQDVLDTAMALCLKRCLEEADRALAHAVRALAAKAREHRATPMLGRTLMQPAIAITAGLKLARWAVALGEDRERLAEAQSTGLALQLGGPVGALEAFGTRDCAVRQRMARTLGLADARSWQAHRNGWIDLLARIGLVVITTGKIARDVALLSQPEVGEMQESPPREGVGRSSAMPHKRNPVGCVHALAAATRVPGLLAIVHAGAIAEHERALGGWQAELATVADIAGCLGTSLDFLDTISASLVVDAGRMAANLRQYGEGPGDTALLAARVDVLLADLAAGLS